MFTPRISVFFFINPTFASFYHRCLSIEKTSRNNTRLIEESIVFGSRIYVIIRKNLQKIRTDSDKGSKRNEARAYKSDGTERQKGRSPFLPPPSMPVSRKNGSKSNRNGNKIVKPYVGHSQERNRSRSRRPRAERGGEEEMADAGPEKRAVYGGRSRKPSRSWVPPPRASRPCRRARVHRCRDISQPVGRRSVNGDVWSHLTGHYRIKYRQPAFSGARRNRGRKMPESIRRPPSSPPLASTIRVHPHPLRS